jgi:small-conductance mechanosensitive channel
MERDLEILYKNNTQRIRRQSPLSPSLVDGKSPTDSQNESNDEQKVFVLLDEIQRQSKKQLHSIWQHLCSAPSIAFSILCVLIVTLVGVFGARSSQSPNEDFVFYCAITALICVLAFPLSRLVLFAVQETSHKWLAMQESRECAPAPKPDEEEDEDAARSCCLELTYYIEDAQHSLAMLMAFSIITLSFYLLMDIDGHSRWQVPPVEGVSDFVVLLDWARVERVITRILGIITIYFGGTVVTDVLTSVITRGLNVGNFSSKIQTLLHQQLMIIKLTGGVPYKEDAFMYSMVLKKGGEKKRSPLHTKYLLTHCFKHPFRLIMHSKPDDFTLFDMDVQITTKATLRALSRVCFRNVKFHLLPMVTDSVTQLRVRQRSDQADSALEDSARTATPHVAIDVSSSSGLNLHAFGDSNVFYVDDHDDDSDTASSSTHAEENTRIFSRTTITYADLEKTLERRCAMDKDPAHIDSMDPQVVWNFLSSSPMDSSSSSIRQCTVYDFGTAFHNLRLRREHFSKSIRDSELMKQNVHMIIAIVMNILVIFIAIALFGYDINQAWLSFSSLVIASSFVFSSAASKAFSALVFLISVNPFDVGDIVIIEKDLYKILRITLMYSRVQRWDGAVLNLSNFEISSQNIINLREIGFWYHYPVFIDIDTVTDDNMQKLHQFIQIFIQKNKKRFTGKFAIGCKDVASLLKTKLVFSIEHRYTEDFAKFSADVTKCHSAIADALASISAKYSGVEIGVMRLNPTGVSNTLPHISSSPGEENIISEATF